jgi:hypothetical protein
MYGAKTTAPILAYTGLGIQVGWGIATAAALIFGGIALVRLTRRRGDARP